MPREVAVLPRSSCPVPYSAPDSAQGGTGILWACPEGEGGGEGTGDPIRSLRESWPLQALLGRQSGWVGGPESRALPSWCVRVWGGCIIGRRVSAPSGKVFPCIRAAQAWSRLGGGELCVRRGIRWLIVREAPWKLPETRYQLLPGPPPQTHHSGGGVGAGLAQQSPLPAPPPTGTPSGLPLPTRQLKCPMGPQGTKRSLFPKCITRCKSDFPAWPRRFRITNTTV